MTQTPYLSSGHTIQSLNACHCYFPRQRQHSYHQEPEICGTCHPIHESSRTFHPPHIQEGRSDTSRAQAPCLHKDGSRLRICIPHDHALLLLSFLERFRYCRTEISDQNSATQYNRLTSSLLWYLKSGRNRSWTGR